MSAARPSKHGHAPAAPGQSHLPAPAPAMDENARIDKLVSLTYDSDARVRRQAAQELSKIDDPRAIFALLELTSDRDESIKNTALAGLENFKEEKDAIINLEKIFEARQEGKPPPEDVEAAKKKLMPSIERLFSKNKSARDKLAPSIEKLFSWIQPKGFGGKPAPDSPGAPPAPLSAQPLPGASPSAAPPASAGASAVSLSTPPPAGASVPLGTPSKSMSAFERVATAHMPEERQAPPPSAPAASGDADDEDVFEEDEDDRSAPSQEPRPEPHEPGEITHAQRIELASQDPLGAVERIREADPAELGIPPQMRGPDYLQKRYHFRESAPSPHAPRDPTSAPSQQEMDQAVNFPLPQGTRERLSSVLSIPSMTGDVGVVEEEEGEKLPKGAFDYYRWAYAMAIRPGVKTADLKKEQDRLIKQVTSDIKTAFQTAVKQAKENGIESLHGLKPGMKHLTTLPLQVLAISDAQVPKSKTKSEAMRRLVLSDSKHEMPLYVWPPSRANGIQVGDLLALRDAQVEFFVHSNEMVLSLGKHGQMNITR